MRILALDWGTQRIGAAVSDPSGTIAFPLDQFIESKNAIDEIKKIISELSVEKVLLGLPKGLSGQNTKSTDLVYKFLERLKDEISLPVELLDERFSSISAGKILVEQGLSQKDQRAIKDNIAAQLMLQQYLDTKNEK